MFTTRVCLFLNLFQIHILLISSDIFCTRSDNNSDAFLLHTLISSILDLKHTSVIKSDRTIEININYQQHNNYW